MPVESSGPEMYVICIGLFLSLLSLGYAIYCGKRNRLVDDIPTSKVLGVFVGLVEVKVTCESEDPLRSYLAEKRCIHYDYEIEEHWSLRGNNSRADTRGRQRSSTRPDQPTLMPCPEFASNMQEFVRELPKTTHTPI